MTTQELPDQEFQAFHRMPDGRFYGVVYMQHYLTRIVAGWLAPDEQVVTGYNDVW